MDLTSTQEALKNVNEMLTADGYGLKISGITDAELNLEVVAGPDACADCLVPKDIFASIVQDALPEPLTVNLTYPAESS